MAAFYCLLLNDLGRLVFLRISRIWIRTWVRFRLVRLELGWVKVRVCGRVHIWLITSRRLRFCRPTLTYIYQETPFWPLNTRSATSSGLSISLVSSHQHTQAISRPLHPPALVSTVNPRFTIPIFPSIPSWRPGLQQSTTWPDISPRFSTHYLASNRPHHQFKPVRQHHKWHSPW